MKKKLFKYAYFQKNIRDLSFEKKILFGVQILTMFGCFAPWFSAEPIAYQVPILTNAFTGVTFLMGWLIFIIALGVSVFFLDRLLEKEKIKLPFSENFLYFFSHGLQLLLIVLAWSVLSIDASGYGTSEIRFGLFFCLIIQIVGFVSAYLNYQASLQAESKAFFKYPKVK